MSALPAYIIAPLYWISANPLFPLQLYSLTCSIVFLTILVYMVNKLLGRRIALYTAIFMTFPPYHLFIWLMGIHGYELFLIVSLLYMWCLAQWLRNADKKRRFWLYCGAVIAGAGWYLHPMFIYNIMSFWIVAAYHVTIEKQRGQTKQLLNTATLWIVFFVVGSILYWIGQIYLDNSYNAVTSISLHPREIFQNIIMLFTSYLPAVLSLDRGPLVIRIASIASYLGITAFVVYALVHWIQLWFKGQIYIGLIFIVSLLSILLIFAASSPSSTIVEVRHLTPLITVWAVLIALCLHKITRPWRWLRYVLFTVILVHNIVSATETICPQKNYMPLINYLSSQRLTRGFASYWLAYPVLYLSNESIILAPFGRIGREEQYMTQAANTPDCAYIFDIDDSQQQDMMALFSETMQHADITFEKKQFANYVIFHNLHDAKRKSISFFQPIDISYIAFRRNQNSSELILPNGNYTVIIGGSERTVSHVQVTNSKVNIPLGEHTPERQGGYLYCIKQQHDQS